MDADAAANTTASATAAMTLHIHPTTGGQFELQVPRTASVDNLKKMVSKRLKVPKERICLLLRERHLREGSLQQNSVRDGCKITLLPNVETGLLAQRPEQSVMQALESLSDAQVSDFLSGKAPLNLTMRLGDHMMFIQLQLSTVAPTTPRKTSIPSTSTTQTTPTTKFPASPTLPLVDDASAASPSVVPQWPTHSSCQQKPVLDAKALAEASRNLTQTLRQLSTAALSSRTADEDVTSTTHALRRRQGAIIESMHHHGRGVYSGTFSGTLNPALQDKHGRPKRDISTIIHILNDLLGATPQYRRHFHRSDCQQGTKLPTESLPANKSQEEFHQMTLENKATRGKMEQLQLMLEERRARRRARREARSPYPMWSSSNNNSQVVVTEAGGRAETTPRTGDPDNNSPAPEFHTLPPTETMVV